MIFWVKITICVSALVWWEIVECIPRNRVKNIEVKPLPVKQFNFVLEKITPFRKYSVKHVINKRQIAQSELPPVSNEIPIAHVMAVEDVAKLQEGITEKKDFIPEVIITSIIKPIENSKSFSFGLPEEPEVLPEPAAKIPVIPVPIPKPREVVPPLQVVEITPKPVIVPAPLPPPAPQPIVQNVAVIPPPPEPYPIIQNVAIKTVKDSKIPFRVPLLPSNSEPIPRPLLYTDISQIPFSGGPVPTPVQVPIPEYILPPPPPPPPLVPVPEPPIIKEPPLIKEPPAIKEETPNIFVKGSRFVLYFGSMMLQMLSQLVNGRINLNQPLPANLPLLPGIQ